MADVWTGSGTPPEGSGYRWDSNTYQWVRGGAGTQYSGQSDDQHWVDIVMSGPFAGVVQPFMNIAEVRPLIAEMARRGQDGSDQSAWFTAQLRQTNWWQQSTAASQQWQGMSEASRQQAQQATTQKILDLYRSEGGSGWLAKHPEYDAASSQLQDVAYRINSGQLPWEVFASATHANFIQDQSTDAYVVEQQHQEQIAQQRKRPQDIAEELWQSAHGDYFLGDTQFSKDTAVQWANGIVNGTSSRGEFQDYMRTTASNLYAKYADQIKNGITPGALFAPALGILSKELEISPEAVKANGALWSQVAAQGAGTDKPFTSLDWIKFARNQPDWRFTQGANDQADAWTYKLAQMFGKSI